jgi:hypothetical protein
LLIYSDQGFSHVTQAHHPSIDALPSQRQDDLLEILREDV